MTRQAVTTIQTQVYEMLKDELVSGEYSPNTRLQELEVAKRYNVSRSPVREAFRQLMADGLLVGQPNKGVFVPDFTVDDIIEINEMRVLLESYAISRLKNGIAEDKLAAVSDALEGMKTATAGDDVEAYQKYDSDFHRALVNACGNHLLSYLYDQTYTRVRLFISYALITRSRMPGSMPEHQAVYDYIVAGEIDRAVEANRDHLMTTCDVIVKRFRGEEPIE